MQKKIKFIQVLSTVFYCYEEKKSGTDYYPLFAKYFGNPEKVLRKVKTNPFDKKTIYEEIEKVKSILMLQNLNQ